MTEVDKIATYEHYYFGTTFLKFVVYECTFRCKIKWK